MVEGNKYLKQVILASDVYTICLQHALSNEKEEIMGLLIGEVDEVQQVSQISAVIILHRSDKQPDRVEISPENIFSATVYAEEIAKKTNMPMRVVGWYHSHPHITVWPSHVDVRTQSSYQMLDAFFVGLIFAVYQNDNTSTTNTLQVTCFQAMRNGTELERREIELLIKPTPLNLFNLQAILKLPRILFEEEMKSHADETSQTRDDLTILHNDAIKTVELGHIVSQIVRPLCTDVEERLVTTKARIAELKKLKKQLILQK